MNATAPDYVSTFAIDCIRDTVSRLDIASTRQIADAAGFCMRHTRRALCHLEARGEVHRHKIRPPLWSARQAKEPMTKLRARDRAIAWLTEHPGATRAEVMEAIGCTPEHTARVLREVAVPIGLEPRDGAPGRRRTLWDIKTAERPRTRGELRDGWRCSSTSAVARAAELGIPTVPQARAAARRARIRAHVEEHPGCTAADIAAALDLNIKLVREDLHLVAVPVEKARRGNHWRIR